MGGHGPTPCGTCAPGQLVRLTGRPERAMPLSCGVKRSAAFGLLVGGRKPGVYDVYGCSGAHWCLCVSASREPVHTVATSLPAWHMGWLQGHVLRSWSSSTHRASWEQGTACDRLQVLCAQEPQEAILFLIQGME